MNTLENSKPIGDMLHQWVSIFTSRDILDGCFRNPEWEIFLLSHELQMPEEDFGWLRIAAESVGDSRLSVLSADLNCGVQLEWDYESLHRIAVSVVAVNGVFAFGDSAVWGMVCTNDDFSLLGGIPEFMDRYAKEAGGRQALRDSFMDLLSPPGWLVPEHLTGRLLELARWK